MNPHPNLTPPIADFLRELEENRKNFTDGIFPTDGWIRRADDGNGYIVRLVDKFGLTMQHCPSFEDGLLLMMKTALALTTGRYVARQVALNFYQKYFDAVDSRQPRRLTVAEAKLCGQARKISEAMNAYTESLQGKKGSSEANREFHRAAIQVDRLIKRANVLYNDVVREAAK
ncbi:hypothetical protein ASC96_31005 [Rhizobium sp. Root1204]|nr:hypothetical protein ASC96_31005 [Rhizobium sp. Root1204]